MGGFNPDVIASTARQLVSPRLGVVTAVEFAQRSLAVDRTPDLGVALARRGFDVDDEHYAVLLASVIYKYGFEPPLVVGYRLFWWCSRKQAV